ncbi:MAG: hypothetical protein ACE5O2_15080 [Armatimonadota bacterium]
MGLANEYLAALERNVSTVVRQEWTPLQAAADLICRARLRGRTVYEALGGHLMPGEADENRRGRPRIFTRIGWKEAGRLRDGDVVLMSNQYGVLERYVEFAITAKARGATLIAMAPRSDPKQIVRSHRSGTSVTDHADIVIDTHVPVGDVAVSAPAGGPGSCPTSGVIQAMLYWALTCGVAQRLAAAGRPPEVPAAPDD